MNLAIGIDEVRKFDYKFNPKIQIGDQSKIKLIVSPAKQEITFRGLKGGKTSVTIRDASGDIRDIFLVNVTTDGNSNIVRELRELIGDIEGIEINIRGGKVIVEGEIVVPDKIGRISTVLARYPEVMALVEYSKQTQVIVAREMQDAINKSAMKDVTVRVVNGDYWLEGVVNSEGKKILAKSIATAYKPARITGLAQTQGGGRYEYVERGQIVDFINVNEKKDPEPPAKLVKVSAQFVELSKDYSKFFSFKWQPVMTNNASISFGKTSEGGVTTEENGSLSGTISRLFPQLQSAKSAGYARIIQSGMAVTNENQQVTISKSSNIDFAVGSGDNTVAKSSRISFTLQTTPSIGVEENVLLKSLKVSVQLPNRGAASSNPQTTNNEINTNLTIKSRESAVIGGIIQSSSLTDYDKDPNATPPQDDGTQQASSLFNLFRGKSYGTNKTQFVVFVTPEILESASRGTEEIRKKFRKRER